MKRKQFHRVVARLIDIIIQLTVAIAIIYLC